MTDVLSCKVSVENEPEVEFIVNECNSDLGNRNRNFQVCGIGDEENNVAKILIDLNTSTRDTSTKKKSQNDVSVPDIPFIEKMANINLESPNPKGNDEKPMEDRVDNGR